MKLNVSSVVNDLISIADSLEIYGTPLWGPHPLFTYITKLETTTLKIKCCWHPIYIRARAEKLRLSVQRFGNGLTGKAKECNRASKFKPNLRRAGYSKKLAQQFLNDREKDNYEAYQELFK